MGLKIKRGKWDQILSRYIFVVQLYGCLPLENQMVLAYMNLGTKFYVALYQNLIMEIVNHMDQNMENLTVA